MSQQESTYQIVFQWSDEDFYQDNVQTLSRLPTPELLAEKSDIALQAAVDTMRAVGERIASTMEDMAHPPSDATLEFGLKLGADTGVITKGQSDAHFTVKLIWRDQQND